MSDEDFNGWTNKPTYLMNLWITNEEGAYTEAREVAAAGVQALEDWAECYTWQLLGFDYGKPTGGSVGVDFVQMGLADVNWREIREALLEGES